MTALSLRDGRIRRERLRRSLLILAFVASVYAGTTVWIGRNGWQLALETISLDDILIVVGLVTFGFLIRAGRWHYYVHALHWNVPLLHSLTAFVASIALTATPGKAGELVKTVLLRSRHDVSLSQGAGILLIERLGDLVAVVILAIGGLALFADLRSYVLASVVVVGVAILLASHPTISRVVLMRLAVVPKLRTLSLKLLNALDAGQRLLRPLPLLVGGGLALVAWSCEALAFHFLINRLAIHSQLSISFSIYGLSTLAGALSMLPGGLGGVEVVMALLLMRLAAPVSVAAAAVVIFRLCTIWLFSLVGVIFMLGWMIFLSRRPTSPYVADAR